MVFFYLVDVVRTWGLAKDVRHKDPLTCERFIEAFDAIFFYTTYHDERCRLNFWIYIKKTEWWTYMLQSLLECANLIDPSS